MNSSGDWQDLAAIEAKINKLGFGKFLHLWMFVIVKRVSKIKELAGSCTGFDIFLFRRVIVLMHFRIISLKVKVIHFIFLPFSINSHEYNFVV